MSAAPLPPYEAERLRTLRKLHLLDTPPEERFDRITRLAQLLFDVPIALVTLVDADRQWFKSRQGLDMKETSREISFCAHAIRGDDLFIIPDASRDERFAGNPMVLGDPGIRFYAGAPLAAPDGRIVGTLCLIDRRPRELTPEQRTSLRDLADLVQGELAQSAGLPVAPQDLLRARSVKRRKVLVGFLVVLVGLAVYSTTSYRVARDFIEISETAAQNRQPLAPSASDRLSDMLIFGGFARVVVIVLALIILLRGMGAAEKAEDELMRSRNAAMGASEGRRVAQMEAERLGERLKAVLDHIDIGVLMVEIDGSVSVYNMAAERIHGAWREQMERLKQAGTHGAMLPDEETVIAPGETPLGRALKGQTVRDVDIFFRTPFRPKGYHLMVSAFPLRDHRGMPTGAVMMFSEIPSR